MAWLFNTIHDVVLDSYPSHLDSLVGRYDRNYDANGNFTSISYRNEENEAKPIDWKSPIDVTLVGIIVAEEINSSEAQGNNIENIEKECHEATWSEIQSLVKQYLKEPPAFEQVVHASLEFDSLNEYLCLCFLEKNV